MLILINILPFWVLSLRTLLDWLVFEEVLVAWVVWFDGKMPRASSINNLAPSSFIEDGRIKKSPSWNESRQDYIIKLLYLCTVHLHTVKSNFTGTYCINCWNLYSIFAKVWKFMCTNFAGVIQIFKHFHQLKLLDKKQLFSIFYSANIENNKTRWYPKKPTTISRHIHSYVISAPLLQSKFLYGELWQKKILYIGIHENQTCSNPENSKNVLACSSCQMTVLNFGLPIINKRKAKTLAIDLFQQEN